MLTESQRVTSGVRESDSGLLRSWQSRLLQLNKRNSLLYFNQKSKMSVILNASDLNILFQNISEAGERGLRLPSVKVLSNAQGIPEIAPGDLDVKNFEIVELQRRLLALRRRDREWEEEQGTNVLFIGFGFLEWTDERGESGYSPLVLLPADLLQESPRHAFYLRREADDPVVNTTLQHKLGLFNIQLPPYSGDSEITVFLDQCEDIVHRARPEWKVHRQVIVSCFSFSKMSMWADIEAIRSNGLAHPVLEAMIHSRSAPVLLTPAQAASKQAIIEPKFHCGRLDEVLNRQEQLHILPADFSQALAIHHAQAGQHLIIHGPPGTGKSQTIANLIGASLASGKSVLFVSEKTAALDVVKRRLERAELGSFCLDLHSERGKKSEVYEQIADSLCTKTVESTISFPSANHQELQATLNEFARSLHDRRRHLNKSVFEVNSRLASLQFMHPNISLSPGRQLSPEHLTQESLAAVMSIAQRLTNHPLEYREHATSFWKILREGISSVGLDEQIRSAAQSLMAAFLSSESASTELSDRLELPRPQTVVQAQRLAAVVRELENVSWSGNYPLSWLQLSNRQGVRQLIKDQVRLSQLRNELLNELGPSRRLAGTPYPFGPVLLNLAGSEPNSWLLNQLFGNAFLPYVFSHGTELIAVVKAQRELVLRNTLGVKLLQESLTQLPVSPSTTDGHLTELMMPDPFAALHQELFSSLSSVEHTLAGAWVKELCQILNFQSLSTFMTKTQLAACSHLTKRTQVSLFNLRCEKDAVEKLIGSGLLNSRQGYLSFVSLVDSLNAISARGMRILRHGTVEECKDIVENLLDSLAECQELEGELRSICATSVTDDVSEQIAEELLSLTHSSWGAFLSTTYRKYHRVLTLSRPHKGQYNMEEWKFALFKIIDIHKCRRNIADLQSKLESAFCKIELDESALGVLRLELESLTEIERQTFVSKETLLQLFADPKIPYDLFAAGKRIGILAEVAASNLQTLDRSAGILSSSGGLVELSKYFEQLEFALSSTGMAIAPVSDLLPYARNFTELITLITRLRNLQEFSASFERNLSNLHLPPAQSVDWNQALLDLDTVDKVISKADGCLDERTIARLVANHNQVQDGESKKLAELQSVIFERQRQLTHFVSVPSNGLHKIAFADALNWLENFGKCSYGASSWLHYRCLVGQLESFFQSESVAYLRGMVDDVTAIPSIIETDLLLKWIEYISAKDTILRKFNKQSHRNKIQTFTDLDKELLPKTSRAEIRRRLLKQYPSDYAKAAAVGEVALLINEIRKQRRRLSIRQLLERAPNALRSLKPCMMMSPTAVSQYLPLEASEGGKFSFDILIVDEASQIFPEEAIPAIARCKQIIVVGDEQQLPPTNFFNRTADDLDDEALEDVQDESLIEGSESILSALRRLTHVGVKECHLNMHYRSRDEALIKFSNRHFYNNRLLTFPSPHRSETNKCIRDCFVEGAFFDSGKTRRNEGEALRVVELVFEHFKTYGASRSLGVVALSRAQADFIFEKIVEKRTELPAYDGFFCEDLPEPFFVKNLENVQGDERDHIILCIGYGRSASSPKVPNRFGPINTAGGERRLNVAVSRARYNLTLVRSLNASDITSSKIGPVLLRQFINYCQAATAATLGESSPTADSNLNLARAIEQRLNFAGYQTKVFSDDEKSPIDLAILSKNEQSFELGLITDGNSYSEAQTARDREWLRNSVLKELGWNIHRVWSAAWIANPDAEIAEIETRVANIRNGIDSVISRQLSIDFLAASRSSTALAETESAEMRIRTATTHEAWLFEPYRIAYLGGTVRTPADAQVTQGSLIRLLVQIANDEGPVHFEDVIERMRGPLGVARISPKLRTRIESLVKELEQSRKVLITREASGQLGFLRSTEKRRLYPRRPAPGTPPRKFDRIAREEIELAVVIVVGEVYSVQLDECVREVANQLGFVRVTQEIYDGISHALSMLVKDAVLFQQGSLYMLNEQYGDLIK